MPETPNISIFPKRSVCFHVFLSCKYLNLFKNNLGSECQCTSKDVHPQCITMMAQFCTAVKAKTRVETDVTIGISSAPRTFMFRLAAQNVSWFYSTYVRKNVADKNASTQKPFASVELK